MDEIFQTFERPLSKVIGVFAVIANSILIYLVINHSPKNMGTYRYLMVYISIFEILYALVDLIVSPILYSKDSGLVVILDSSRSGLPIEVLWVFNIIFCGSFGTSMAIFAIHFVFRYLILKGNRSLTSSNPLVIFVWLLIPVIYGVIWACLCMTTMFPTPQTDKFLQETYIRKFPAEIGNLTYFGPYFYPEGKLNWKPCIGIASCSFIMTISSLTMVICGIKCYNRIQNLVHTTSHSKTNNTLHRQFLTALIVETLIPVFLMHIPAAITYSACIFNSSFEVLGDVLTISIALYPAIDPLPPMIIVGTYRNAILNFIGKLGCNCNWMQKFVEAISDPSQVEDDMDVL